VLAAAALPAGAQAALPTLGPAEGVALMRSGTTVQFRLTGTAATAIARYAGRRVSIACEQHPPPGLLFAQAEDGPDASIVEGDADVERAAAGALVVRTTMMDAAYDLCVIERSPKARAVGRQGPFRLVVGSRRPPLARVTLTAAGAAYVDEVARVAAMWDAIAPLNASEAPYPPPAAAASLGLFALAGPGARRRSAASATGATAPGMPRSSRSAPRAAV
jgi:hypothetical protein